MQSYTVKDWFEVLGEELAEEGDFVLVRRHGRNERCELMGF